MPQIQQKCQLPITATTERHSELAPCSLLHVGKILIYVNFDYRKLHMFLLTSLKSFVEK